MFSENVWSRYLGVPLWYTKMAEESSRLRMIAFLIIYILFRWNIIRIDILNVFRAKTFNFGQLFWIFIEVSICVTALRVTNSAFITPRSNIKMTRKPFLRLKSLIPETYFTIFFRTMHSLDFNFWMTSCEKPRIEGFHANICNILIWMTRKRICQMRNKYVLPFNLTMASHEIHIY